MDQYELIRTAHRVYKKGIREIAREYGHHRQTIRRALSAMEPAYRKTKKKRVQPVMGQVAAIIEGWLRQDQDLPKKQRHTARRIHSRLVEEHGFEGSESNVRQWVRQCRTRLGIGAKTKAVIPLDPEVAKEAEVDWGSAVVKMAGEQRQVKLFCMRSRFSGKSFVRGYPWERQEMFFDGHMNAFAYFGGVFPVLVYDNLKAAVRKILRGKRRVEQDRFVAFRSYYTFEAWFCNVRKGREKGGVEGLVGFARRNFLVPIPEVESFEELNNLLLQRCLQHSRGVIEGRDDNRSIEQRHQEEQQRLLELPQRPYENSKPIRVRISPYQTAQVDRNRYSVPTAYVGRWLWAHVGCDTVRLYADQELVAEHPRIFSNSKWQIDPQHYLDLICERVAAFDSARPIRQWRSQWPSEYETMLEMLRKRKTDNKGIREFVRILQLHRQYSDEEVHEAVQAALQHQAYSYEAVKHMLIWKQPSPCGAVPLDADLIPGVTDLSVGETDLIAYDRLLTGGVQ